MNENALEVTVPDPRDVLESVDPGEEMAAPGETVFVEVVDLDRPFFTTPLENYSVTEGLLLLIFLFVLIRFFLDLLRRWF